MLNRLFHKFMTQQDKDNKLLSYAAEGNVDKVVKYIKLGANVNVKVKETCYTPLILAVIHKKADNNHHEEIVKNLLNAQSDMNITDKFGNSPLYYAATDGDNELIKIFLHAAYIGTEEFNRMLLKNDASEITKANIERALQAATQSGNQSTVKLLQQALDSGNINIRQKENYLTLSLTK